MVCNFFEAHVFVITHDKYFPLAVWKGLDKFANIGFDLVLYNCIFDGSFAQFFAIKDIHVFIIGDNIIIGFFLSEKIDNEIMGDSGNPCRELTVFGIASLLDSHDSLDKSFLKDVIRQFFVFYNIINVVESTDLMSFKQNIKSSIITFGIQRNQFFVGAIE